jgi:serine/threonine protein kinase
MEIADDGDLEEKIKLKSKNSESFSEGEIWNIFIQSLRGLLCLHESYILHRDLKVSNILTIYSYSELMFSCEKMEL